jgi:hypothetical protein
MGDSMYKGINASRDVSTLLGILVELSTYSTRKPSSAIVVEKNTSIVEPLEAIITLIARLNK